MSHYKHRQKLYTTDLFTSSKTIIFYIGCVNFYTSLNREQKRDIWTNRDLGKYINLFTLKQNNIYTNLLGLVLK